MALEAHIKNIKNWPKSGWRRIVVLLPIPWSAQALFEHNKDKVRYVGKFDRVPYCIFIQFYNYQAKA